MIWDVLTFCGLTTAQVGPGSVGHSCRPHCGTMGKKGGSAAPAQADGRSTKADKIAKGVTRSVARKVSKKGLKVHFLKPKTLEKT